MSQRTLLLAAAGLLVMSGCAKKADEEKAEAPAPVQVTAVTQETIRRTVEGDGVLFPQDQAGVVPKVSAPVLRFLVNRGDRVRAGQLVATLENRDLSAAVAESRGQLNQAESNLRSTSSATIPEEVTKAEADVQSAQQTLDAAQKLLENRQKLLEQGALARKLVDEAQVSYAQAKSQLQTAQAHLRVLQNVGKEEQVKTAQAQVEAARGHLQSAEAQVTYSEVRSPITGVVADRPLNAGEMASAGTPLLTVVDIAHVVARVNVPQSEAATVKVGQPATITQTGQGDKLEGKVTVVSPATDANSTTVQVWVAADNPGDRFKPGAAVHAAIVTQTIRNAAVVPVSAILPGEGGGTAVLTVSPDSTAHLRPVEVGVRYGDKAQIVSGVMPGDEVVVVGGLGVDDKAKVKIVGAAEEEADEDEDQPAAAPAASKDAKKDDAKPKAK
jgi:multidrug efflux pump subunit AcrA (membrane-fusion protein)